MSDVRLEHAVKTYNKGSVTALSDVSFACKEGEFFTLLGPSGAGKTTTLEVIAGLKKLDSGKVFMDNQDVTDMPVQDRDVAMAFENYALYSHLKVYENIAFPLRSPRYPEKLTRAQEREKVEYIANRLGIGEYLDRMPKQLSGGQKQRVSLARAMVRKPRLFLLDEPIAHLDAKLKAMARSDLKRIAREVGTTILYVTHNYHEALALSDRILIMREGHVEQIGTPEQIYFEPASDFVANLVGDPPINLLDGELTEQDGKTHYRSGAFDFELDERNAQQAKTNSWEDGGKCMVRMGFRAEDTRVSLSAPNAGSKPLQVLVTERKSEDELLKFRMNGSLIIANMGKYEGEDLTGKDAYVTPDFSKVHYFKKTVDLSLEDAHE